MIIGDIETTEKVEYEDLLKNYYEKMEIIEEQDKEIERLNNKVEELMTLYTTERNVKEDYKSIIKEVREYIKEWQKFPHTNGSTHKELKNLIDILDKDR